MSIHWIFMMLISFVMSLSWIPLGSWQRKIPLFCYSGCHYPYCTRECHNILFFWDPDNKWCTANSTMKNVCTRYWLTQSWTSRGILWITQKSSTPLYLCKRDFFQSLEIWALEKIVERLKSLITIDILHISLSLVLIGRVIIIIIIIIIINRIKVINYRIAILLPQLVVALIHIIVMIVWILVVDMIVDVDDGNSVGLRHGRVIEYRNLLLQQENEKSIGPFDNLKRSV